MKEEKLTIKLLPDAEMLNYGHEDTSSFDFKLHSFKRVFKGKEELDMDAALKYSVSQGRITLRPFERVQVGTGIFMELPENMVLQITTKPGLALEEGVIVFDSPRMIDSNFTEEICIILYNSSQFLARIKIGDRIAKGTFTPSEKYKFLLKT